ncbi:serine/threonine protein kinase, partial [Myxococcota bacterium]|nr:serine/threonine protein kinase [Myxococcota bacterium]
MSKETDQKTPGTPGRTTLPAGTGSLAQPQGESMVSDQTLLAVGTPGEAPDAIHSAETMLAPSNSGSHPAVEEHFSETVLATGENSHPDGGTPSVTPPGQGETLAAGTSPAAVAAAFGNDFGAARHTILPRAKIENGSVTWIHTKKTRLEILSLLGEGGAGEVLIGMDHDIGRKVAVKKIRSTVKSPAMIMRFIEEIRTVGRLEHPNIIPIHDVGVDASGDYYFVMKYIEGETLEDIIERLHSGDKKTHAEYPFERRVEVFRGVLEAVRYAHSQKIIHRDIKP